ncbi:HAD family phosphatase [Candidatus Saccharibacteria bacterium]|nr:HAD family phosphatase [Candidatus Saccharibacteria bacterium]
MATTIKGFFFDLDGTLVNTYEADFYAYRDAIEQVMGVVVERDAFMGTNGMEMRQKLEILTPGVTPEQANAVAAGKKKFYKNHMHTTVPNETLLAFMADMAKHYTVALVTTAKQQNAQTVLEKYGISDLFDIKVFGDSVKNAKPHPESYLKALELSGLDANEVLAFEDSISGLESAHAAGIKTIHIRSFA